ncbi:MAG: integrase arm-type DNA-binding domain-containing protein [Proteobacteria bacterium]|nr:integrase arm-type DNA-binding domain-containing protein [Pseudomonadota bacterium]
MGKLTALKVQQLTKPGSYGDGGCLYLYIKSDGKSRYSRAWVYRFKLNGQRREMGLGPVALVSLADARIKTLEYRKMHLEGIDPIEVRKAKREQAKIDRKGGVTFRACAERYIASHKAGWKNDKHAAQWPSSLGAYVYPIIGAKPVYQIDTAQVMKVLEPIWATKAETASRVRGRIETILDWAKVHSYRTGDNPARWHGHLDKLLPSRSRVKRIKHHPALPYAEMSSFMAKLRAQEGVAARALEFLILTVARTSEVIGTPPNEIKGKVWIVPPERMKAGQEHRVPLTVPALAVAESMKAMGGSYLFPGRKLDAPLSNMAMLKLLARMGHPGLTAHGFRSTFKDWVSECTDYPSEVSEMALAHTIDNKVEAAYRRGDLFRKRIALMDDWARFCAGEEVNHAAT